MQFNSIFLARPHGAKGPEGRMSHPPASERENFCPFSKVCCRLKQKSDHTGILHKRRTGDQIGWEQIFEPS